MRFIQTHTGGEPTHIIVDANLDLGSGSMADRRKVFREKYDHIRTAITHEPRGSEVVVGAVLCEPTTPGAVAGVIFFNNVDVLWMCGHGTIGVAVDLAHLGRIGLGRHQLDTPVGTVEFELFEGGRVTIKNVASYRHATNVPVEVPGHGVVHGDIAWGGNWFFLVSDHGQQLTLDNVDALTNFSWRIRQALEANNITGAEDGEIDHIELFGPPADSVNDSRNFVLCPGKAYDRSPCGTGTSAKLACLAADGKLQPGETWRQESIVGSLFEGRYELAEGQCIPEITGTAYVNGDVTMIFDENDPFRFGIPQN